MVIHTAMNVGSTIPFLQGSSNLEYSFSGVRVVQYVRGVPDKGMYVVDHSSSNSYGGGSVEGGNIKGASLEIDAANTSALSSSMLSTVGIVLISIGTIAMIGILVRVIVTAKQRRMGSVSFVCRCSSFGSSCSAAKRGSTIPSNRDSRECHLRNQRQGLDRQQHTNHGREDRVSTQNNEIILRRGGDNNVISLNG